MRRFALAVLFIVSPACAQVLGGLDEGQPRDAGRADASSQMDVVGSSEKDATACTADWLAPFRRRVPVDVVNDGEAVDDVQVKLSLDTGSLVRAQKLRPDGADIRIVGPTGAVAPHWTETRIGGDATILWTKTRLERGKNVLFLYYDHPEAAAPSSASEVFVDGVIANGGFDLGTARWAAYPPPSGDEYLLVIEEGRARVEMTRPAGDGPATLGWCQAVTFPADAAYRVIFDTTITKLALASAFVRVGGMGGKTVWQTSGALSRRRGVETDRIDPGSTQLCFGATLAPHHGAQYFSGTFTSFRVRRFVEPAPLADVVGSEERACRAR